MGSTAPRLCSRSREAAAGKVLAPRVSRAEMDDLFGMSPCSPRVGESVAVIAAGDRVMCWHDQLYGGRDHKGAWQGARDTREQPPGEATRPRGRARAPRVEARTRASSDGSRDEAPAFREVLERPAGDGVEGRALAEHPCRSRSTSPWLPNVPSRRERPAGTLPRSEGRRCRQDGPWVSVSGARYCLTMFTEWSSEVLAS